MTEEPRQPGAGGVPPEPPAPPPSGYQQSGYGQPGGAQPGYPPPGGAQPGYPPPGAAQQGYGDPTGATPGYGPPAYGAPGDQSGMGQPGANRPASMGGLQGFDPKSINPLDWGIIAAGLIAFIFSTFDYFTYKITIDPFSRKGSTSAWHGVLAPFATLLVILASALLAVHLIAKLQLAFPVRLVVLAAFALASLLLLLALFVVPGNTGGLGAFGVKIEKGHGIGYWVSLLAVLAGTGLSFKRFTDTGGKLPTRS